MELGDFLRAMRGRLRPESVGVTSYGSRRVPGLRREELARLAGVSVTYYTRLEQGQSQNASDEVLDAIARALRLNDDEIAHLRDLARPAKRRERPVEPARPGVEQMVAAMHGVAAIALDQTTDVLAWNPLAHRLLAGHLDAHPNLMRLLFLDAHTRELYARWDEEAARAVASLRLVAGRYADDSRMASLVGELSLKSPEFAALWSRHPVVTCASGTKYFHHPVVGHLELQFEMMELPGDTGQRLLVYTAEPGSASEAAFRLL